MLSLLKKLMTLIACKPAKARSLRTQLQVETLEERELLAGNITAQIVRDGTAQHLVIKGDNLINGVQNRFTNSYYVHGLREGGADTTVNGRKGPAQFNSTLTDLRIYTYGGNDKIQVVGESWDDRIVLKGDLIINSGAYSDEIMINYARAKDDVRVWTGQGAKDQTFMWAVTSEDDMTIESDAYKAGDRDIVKLNYCVIGSPSYYGTLGIDLHNGNDSVYLNDCSTDYLKVNLWDGSDYLDMRYCSINQFRSSYINGGPMWDTVNWGGQNYHSEPPLNNVENVTRIP